MSEKFSSRLPFSFFIAGLMVLAFGGGIVATYFDWFPIPLLKRAKLAAAALVSEETETPVDRFTFPARGTKTGVTIYDSNRAYDGYTFITAYRQGRCTNLLLDMQGEVVHEWYVSYSQVWEKAPFLTYQSGDEFTFWHGVHLYPNGDVILVFSGIGFPEGWGTVKLDKDSNIVWSLPRNTHHDVHVTEDGTIFIPALTYHTEPVSDMDVVVATSIASAPWNPPFEEDLVLEVSPAGEVLSEFSVFRALQRSDFKGLLSLKYSKTSEDPTHLNDIEVVTEAWAAQHPFVEAGDLIVSLRNMNTVAAVDRETKIVKWAMTGNFLRQHDPDLLPNGNLLLYDNWGADPATGRTQIIEIDPDTQEIVWRYTGSPESPLHSEIRGNQQPLPNGNVLISEPEGGRVLEVTRDPEPVIVWEYRNEIVAGSDGAPRVGVIVQALRFGPRDLTFVGGNPVGEEE